MIKDSLPAFLCIADTHGYLTRKRLEKMIKKEWDFCLLLGDVSLGDIALILEYIPKEKIAGVCGNHDRYPYALDGQPTDPLRLAGITNLYGNVISVCGYTVTGMPGVASRDETDGCTPFSQDESVNAALGLPEVDILVAHSPCRRSIPSFVPDYLYSHFGMEGINVYLRKHPVQWFLHGHQHLNYRRRIFHGIVEDCVYGVRICRIKKKKKKRNDRDGKGKEKERKKTNRPLVKALSQRMPVYSIAE